MKSSQEKATKVLISLANASQMMKGNGFRVYSTKVNGGSKNRNENTWVDKISRKAQPYFGNELAEV